MLQLLIRTTWFHCNLSGLPGLIMLVEENITLNWLNRVSGNILPVSHEKFDVSIALKEWDYLGDMNDLELPSEDCEICEHQDIRYQFEIVNRLNGNRLLIGSECITRFGGIAVISSSGEKLTGMSAKKKVTQDHRRMVAKAKTRSVLNSLINLKSKDEKFDIDDFIKYYEERGAFTPKQLVTIIWRFEKFKINFEKKFFKLTIKRKREKDQLIAMEEFKIETIRGCFSPSQKKFYIEKKDHR